MGIYPDREFLPTKDGYIEEVRTPGLIRRRALVAGPWTEVRSDCFCCSCPDDGGHDPYCRNHGFAGERPCQTHEMPGQTDDMGVMPDSVEAVRARRA